MSEHCEPGPSSPLPLAGGVGGRQTHAPTDPRQHGYFQPRDTERARELRRQATPAERKLLRAIEGSKLGGLKFSRQMPVGPYFADFLCGAAKLIVEIDGFSHETRQAEDRRRDKFLADQGFAVLRFSNSEVLGNLEGVVRAMSFALAERCPPPTPPASGRGVRRTPHG
jgi:very-short-patch-repair endonuclease